MIYVIGLIMLAVLGSQGQRKEQSKINKGGGVFSIPPEFSKPITTYVTPKKPKFPPYADPNIIGAFENRSFAQEIPDTPVFTYRPKKSSTFPGANVDRSVQDTLGYRQSNLVSALISADKY